MPYPRRTLQALIRWIKSDIQTRLVGSDPLLRRTVETVLARAQAAAAHGLHGHIEFTTDQLFPDTAEGRFLARHANFWLENGKLEASAFSCTISVTGTVSTAVPVDTQWQNSEGDTYTNAVAGATDGIGDATIAVEADATGTSSNVEAGATLSLVNPVSGIDTDATVDAGSITNGTDTEADEDLSERILLAIKNAPDGGGPGDYINWMREVTGVTRAWEFPLNRGAGTVDCTFVQDGNTDISPTAPKITEVQAYLDARAPMTADVSVFDVTEQDLDFTISVTPDTTAVRAAVQAELEDLILRVAAPEGTTFLSQINEAISLAEGETDHTLTVPAADVTVAINKISVMGTITWT